MQNATDQPPAEEETPNGFTSPSKADKVSADLMNKIIKSQNRMDAEDYAHGYENIECCPARCKCLVHT